MDWWSCFLKASYKALKVHAKPKKGKLRGFINAEENLKLFPSPPPQNMIAF